VAHIGPLRALHYEPRRIGEMSTVVAPPYDVISPAVVARLYDRSPYNVVRLILNREDDRHEAAAREMRSWRSQGIIVEEPRPALWLYSQTFAAPRLGRLTRDGIIGLLRLEDFETGCVRPHERTLEAPKVDRGRLMRACSANLSPIFGLVSRPGIIFREVVAPALESPPSVDLVDDMEVRHRLWPVTDPDLWAACAGMMRDELVVIADGHHRYETALAYRDEMRRAHPGAGPDAPFESVLISVSNMDEPGVVVLPTHRILPRAGAAEVRAAVAGLTDIFDVRTFPTTERAAFVNGVNRGDKRIGCALPDGFLLLTLRGDPVRLLHRRSAATRELAVVLLHELVMPRLTEAAVAEVEFTHDDREALKEVAEGRAGTAFLVGAPSAHEVRAVCLAGETMPEKSTYFYPKLLTGLVFHSLEV